MTVAGGVVDISPGSTIACDSGSSPLPASDHSGRRQRSSSVKSASLGQGVVTRPLSTHNQVSSRLSAELFGVSSFASVKHFGQAPWLKSSAQPRPGPSLSHSDDRAILNFFAKYILLPYDSPAGPAAVTDRDGLGRGLGAQRASQGFLEFLPCTFEEVNAPCKSALRRAVHAAALADASSELPRPGRTDDTDSASEIRATPCLALGQRALSSYGQALSASSESMGEQGRVPDDYELMTVVILDIFETLFLPDGAVSKGCHVQGMAQMLRQRGHEQLYDARSRNLFRLAHHHLQMQALACSLPPAPVPDQLLDYLDEQMSFMRLEQDAHRISNICARRRRLEEQLWDMETGAAKLSSLVREMQCLDREIMTWRQGPQWAYATLGASDLTGDSAILATFLESLHIHPNKGTAYEWNHHHTSRILLHKQLLSCLHWAAALDVESPAHETENIAPLLVPLVAESVDIVRSLATKILATAPQMMGDIDHDGQIRGVGVPRPRCRAIGAYFLLWPHQDLDE